MDMNYSDYHFTFSIFNRSETRRFEVFRSRRRLEVRMWMFGLTWQCDEGSHNNIKANTKILPGKDAISESFKNCGIPPQELREKLNKFIVKTEEK